MSKQYGIMAISVYIIQVNSVFAHPDWPLKFSIAFVIKRIFIYQKWDGYSHLWYLFEKCEE